MYAFIDTHCHFDFPPFFDAAQATLEQALDGGVEKIVVPSIDVDSMARVLTVSASSPRLYPALGLHPLYIERHQEQSLQRLAELIERHRRDIVAIGEIGLDNYMANPHMPRQLHFLDEQIRLAKAHQLPLILHSRRTHDQLAKKLRQHQWNHGVVHGFSGSYEQAMAFIDLGFYIGVGGVITYPRANKTRQAIARLPLERLLFETDAPDMPVNGFQGQHNRPERIIYILDALASLREEPKALIASQLYQNSLDLFSL